MVRMQSPKLLSQTPYLFQTLFHLISLSCHFFIIKMLVIYVLFKFLERLKQSLPKIPFSLLAFAFSIGAFFSLWHGALGFPFIFFAGFLHDVVVSCLSLGRKCRVKLLVNFSLKQDAHLIPHLCQTGPALRSLRFHPFPNLPPSLLSPPSATHHLSNRQG